MTGVQTCALPISFHLGSYFLYLFNFLYLFRTFSPTFFLVFSSGYEVPFVCRLDEVNKLYDEKALTTDEMKFEIDRLLRRDSTRLHGNDPFAMT